ncbi:hypothetical protein LUZ60_005167 [Juncus effusus]|nr:hypothetical protein LUZ60_005167 [Juncus effusus]
MNDFHQRLRLRKEMKGFKSRILRTLKSFPQIDPAIQRPNRLLLIEPSIEECFDASPTITTQEEEEPEELEENEPKSELTVDQIDEPNEESGDKENIGPKTPSKDPPFCSKTLEEKPIFELDSPQRSDLGFQFSSYRRPDPNSATLFDPDLLSAFRQAVADHNSSFQNARAGTRPVNQETDLFSAFEPPNKIQRTKSDTYPSEPFTNFESRCPPGGQNCVILYTTTLHSIRKTFEDCNRIRFLLQNLGINFHERDISMDLGYRDELWKVLGFRAIPPRLFIKGLYIGGAEEAIGLHESGKLRPLTWQFVIGRQERGLLCKGCGGMGFMMCSACNGSHKLYDREEDISVPCLGCNENGLIPCPLCS